MASSPTRLYRTKGCRRYVRLSRFGFRIINSGKCFTSFPESNLFIMREDSEEDDLECGRFKGLIFRMRSRFFLDFSIIGVERRGYCFRCERRGGREGVSYFADSIGRWSLLDGWALWSTEGLINLAYDRDPCLFILAIVINLFQTVWQNLNSLSEPTKEHCSFVCLIC